MDGQDAQEPEPGRDGDDFRWAERLEGITSRDKYANPARPEVSAVTRLLLEAGLQLRDENLATGDGGSTHGMGRVTREKVVRRAIKLYDQRKLSLDGRIRTLTRAFNDRWRQVDRFRRDVIIFEQYTVRWREELDASRRRMVDLVDDLASGRIGAADFIRAVVRLAAAVRSRFLRYDVGHAGLAMEPAYREIAIQAHADFQAEHSAEWINAYRLVMERCGIKLRPGMTLDKAFTWITWLARSGAMEANVTDSDTADLVAEGIIAMITGMVDQGDHRSSEESVDFMFSAGPDDEDG